MKTEWICTWSLIPGRERYVEKYSSEGEAKAAMARRIGEVSDCEVTIKTGFLLPENVEEFSLQNRVTDKTAPTFFFHTSDDPGVSVKHSLVYAAALRDHGVPFEMHIYPHGKHGVGLAKNMPDVSGWAPLAVAWLRRTL